jgi:glucosamine--fructose-6-phosphate aminotransferase (isomerizing)
MCGIVGYTGTKNVTPFLIEGLAALEYRGYDSAGMYVEGAGPLKRAGKVAELRDAITDTYQGTSGIAHTRWATHGKPTETNAHPHTDARGAVWLVHNGIIENHASLREELRSAGVTFRSETDTEVLAQLIGTIHARGASLADAVRSALEQVRGTYGLAVMSEKEPGTIIAARKGSPLLIGVAEDGNYVASDATPLLPYTRSVLYLEEGDLAIVTPSGVSIEDHVGAPVTRTTHILQHDSESARKNGYEHFMLKEIMEADAVVENTLRGRLLEDLSIALDGFEHTEAFAALKKARRVLITGCGSAYYAGLVAKEALEEFVGVPATVEVASELRYRRQTANPEDTFAIAISQSGETADTLEAVRALRARGVLVLAVVNAVGSSLSREADVVLYNQAGPEISVASTKAFVSQITLLTLLALALSTDAVVRARHTRALQTLPEKVRSLLATASQIEVAAKKYASYDDFLYLGRKYQCPIAFEGALKLKEVSYIHAEAYGAGEMKHGPLALIDASFPTLALAPEDALYEKTASNIEEVRARDGKVLAITTEGNTALSGKVDDILYIPATEDALLPILTTIPLQLFAYFVAKERGLPIDMPRNLAKSVTVE